MGVVILDGLTPGAGPALAEVVARTAGELGESVIVHRLASETIAPCQGDFDCWVKTPGQCRTRDDAQQLVRDLHDASLVITLTPLTFGGYGALAKGALDRTICLIEPTFERRQADGLTHHQRRYARYPARLTLAVAPSPEPEAVAVFRALAEGNALNFSAPWAHAAVLDETGGWPAQAASLVRAAVARAPPPPVEPQDPRAALAEACTPSCAVLPVRPTAVTLLVGSARPAGQSTSESLGRGLLAAFDERSVSVRVVHAVAFTRPGKAAERALEAMARADLLVVSVPLYVDTLPALATRALEQLAALRRADPRAVRTSALVGMVNCGFPEPAHARNAVRVLRTCARELDLAWAGGLAMGGGEAVHGRPLEEAGGVVAPQVRALAEAGCALAGGYAIPQTALARMQTQALPSALYRWAGTLGWWWQARGNGVPWRGVHAKPFDARGTPPPPLR